MSTASLRDQGQDFKKRSILPHDLQYQHDVGHGHLIVTIHVGSVLVEHNRFFAQNVRRNSNYILLVHLAVRIDVTFQSRCTREWEMLKLEFLKNNWGKVLFCI